MLDINKNNNMHTKPTQTHIAFIMPRPKGIDSRHSRDNRWFNCKDSHLKRNDFSSLVILVTHTLNDLVINQPHLSSARQESSIYSQNTTPESQASSIPGQTSADLSNTMLMTSTNNISHNIYGCMVDVSKLTPAQRQQNAIILIQHYHELCNTNNLSSMFVSPPSIPNIEQWSLSTISSLGSVSFFRNRSEVNIQQLTTSEVADTETVMARPPKIWKLPHLA